jgi:hypothetical protein
MRVCSTCSKMPTGSSTNVRLGRVQVKSLRVKRENFTLLQKAHNLTNFILVKHSNLFVQLKCFLFHKPNYNSLFFFFLAYTQVSMLPNFFLHHRHDYKKLECLGLESFLQVGLALPCPTVHVGSKP